MGNTSIKDLASKGLVSVQYPPELRASVEKAVAAWEAFCKLPEEIRTQFPYNNAEDMGVGYELKKTPGANLDLKEDFHFATGSREWIEETATSLGNEEIMHFVHEAGKLVDLIEPLILDFAGRVEKEFDLKDFRDEVADSKSIWFVRFLHYLGGRQEGEEIATAHADKDGFTPHLYESDPGLQYLDFQKRWQEMPVSPGETVVLPGMRLQYRSQNRLKAIYHRVVATEKTAAQGRFSVVCFVHPKRTPAYNKKKAGRLQEFQPGFNYDMPFEEFSKLFI
jgi:isopenicillin N synthase-like dioxygenase